MYRSIPRIHYSLDNVSVFTFILVRSVNYILKPTKKESDAGLMSL